MNSLISNELLNLSCELHDLQNGVTTKESSPDALTFYRDYISPNKPVIFQNCIKNWSALKWTQEFLINKNGHSKIPVQVTPNGKADSVTKIKINENEIECFMEPYVEKMSLNDLFVSFENKTKINGDGIPYFQQQNDNINEWFPWMLNDIEKEGPKWAREAFNTVPDAVNLWIGDERSITSFHKDHYENIYIVLSGKKIFTLLPPCDVARMHYKQYLHGKWTRNKFNNELIPEICIPETYVKWSPVELCDDLNNVPEDFRDKWPLFYSNDYPCVLQCEVNAGDVFYLPSLWFHHVQQKPVHDHYVLALNYWYDMQFDLKYVYQKFVEDLTLIIK